MDWKKLIELAGPVGGAMAQGNDKNRAAFLKGWQDAESQRVEQERAQGVIDQRTKAQGADYLMHIGERAQSFDDPVALDQFLSLAEQAGEHAGYTKPGELKGKFTVSQTKIAAKRLKEVDDQLSQLEKSYDLDQLAASGAHIRLQDGTDLPVSSAIQLSRKRPMDASGQAIARPKKADVSASTDYGRFLSRYAKDKGKSVDDLSATEELDARKTFNTIDDKPSAPTKKDRYEQQLDDLVAVWQEAHPGQTLPAATRAQLRVKATKDIGTADDRQLASADDKVWVLRGGKAAYVVKNDVRPGDTPYDRTRIGGRPMLSSDANRIADVDESVKLLGSLSDEIGRTGAGSKVGAMLPNVVTEVTGLGTDAKQRQATIDKVKQIIGKTLEGGVLRKEDEAKYEKILPTIGDPPDVAQSKIAGLARTLKQKRQTLIETLSDAGYDIDRSADRGSSNGSGPANGERRLIKGQPAIWDGKGWKPE